MKPTELRSIKKDLFGYEDIARALRISLPSAKVSASRYVKQGFLIRLKQNMYFLAENWNHLNRLQLFRLTNFLQSPSYISLMTALTFYDISTQIQQNYYESIAVKRTKNITIRDVEFTFTKIQQSLFFGFIKHQSCFIATPEKAFLDGVYLSSLGRYNFDASSIDFNKLNRTKVLESAELFPERTKIKLEDYEYFRTA